MKNILIIILSVSVLLSCNKDDEGFASGTLGKFIEDLGLPTQRDSLIACAAGSASGNFMNGTGNTSVFFYPPTGAENFRYFEIETPTTNTQLDLLTFRQVDHPVSPIFNGYLQRFTGNISNKVCVVTFVKSGKLFISDPITIKSTTQATDINPPGYNIFNASSLEPSFQWSTSPNGIDVIYFSVVADANDNLISGTYTESPNWTFYDLTNVVLNIRDVDPAPTLTANTDYRFVMMAVSDDNWVNSLVDEDFSTN